MKWLVAFFLALGLATGATAKDKDRFELAANIEALASRAQMGYVEEVSAETAWQKLNDAFSSNAANPDAFGACLAKKPIKADTPNGRIAAIAAMLHCGAEKDAYATFADKAMTAFVPSIDPLGSYISKSELASMIDDGEPKGGIGIALWKQDGKIEIVRVAPESPLATYGYRKGDTIEKIDGKDASALTLDAIISLLRGPIGETVALSIKRKADATIADLVLPRVEVKPETFTIQRKEDALIVSYAALNQGGSLALKDALTSKANKDAKYLIIDLRGNQGGLLDETAAIADLFVGKAALFKIVGRQKWGTEQFRAQMGDVWEGKPITVLIDKTTENGAEMLAAALQDMGRATIMGEKTLGLVMIQTVFPLGMDGAMRITSSKVFRAGDRPMRDVGVTPDAAIPEAPANAPQDWWIEYALQASARQTAPKAQ